METDKPFKTIEVIDSRTAQTCKIACMSCIRGHRTTSCGIPVCRSKVFWTVKRPGRPSNSCTCRYGATGGCKCVVAKSACPHKAKKGEKRSGECRCDEQGRYCCLLEADHWALLFALQKPTVDFYPTREALEASRTAAPLPSTRQATPGFSELGQQFFNTTPNSPATPGLVNGAHTSRSSSLTPRFGMMGLGAPQGNDGVVTPNVLSWDGQALPAPQPFSPMGFQADTSSSCCQRSQTPVQPLHISHYVPPDHIAQVQHQNNFTAPNNVMLDVPLPTEARLLPNLFDYNKLTSDYMAYQFPNAICQNCGLNGCTCRNCPPVMQNFNTGSWAQCCGRKHARDVAPPPTSNAFSQQVVAPPTQFGMEGMQQHAPPAPSPYAQNILHAIQSADQQLNLSPSDLLSDTSPFDMDYDLDVSQNGAQMDLSDLLMSELDDSTGCCCGDP